MGVPCVTTVWNSSLLDSTWGGSPPPKLYAFEVFCLPWGLDLGGPWPLFCNALDCGGLTWAQVTAQSFRTFMSKFRGSQSSQSLVPPRKKSSTSQKVMEEVAAKVEARIRTKAQNTQESPRMANCSSPPGKANRFASASQREDLARRHLAAEFTSASIACSPIRTPLARRGIERQRLPPNLGCRRNLQP